MFIASLAWKRSICFSFNYILRELIFYFSKKIGISVEFVMGTLAAAVSALAGKAVIQSLRTFIGSSFYVGLVAPPSSGKSAAIQCIQWAVDHMEQFLAIQDSMLINAPTVESLSKFCENIPAILCESFNIKLNNNIY